MAVGDHAVVATAPCKVCEIDGDVAGDMARSEVVGNVVGSEVVGEIDSDVVGSEVVGPTLPDGCPPQRAN